MKRLRALFLLNSDFGIGNTIGARALPIAQALAKERGECVAYCRDYDPRYKEFTLRRIMPLGSLLMKALSAIPIYVTRRFPGTRIKSGIFERTLLRRLRRLDLSRIDCIHSWESLPEAYRYAKERNPRIVIIQDQPMVLTTALEGIKDKEKLWEGEDLSVPPRIRAAVPYIDAYIVPSEIVKESLERIGVSGRTVRIVPFGVDARKFRVTRKSASPFRVAFSGVVSNRKGIPYLVRAWKELGLRNAELHLYGRVYPEVQRHLKDARRHRITVHGFVDIAKELPKNHLFVFPSLMEGSAKAVYEALACGLPVITTRNAGSVVEDGKDGFIVPVQDVAALKERIRFFYGHPDRVAAFGKRARKKAERYTWERYGQAVVQAYKDAARKGGRR